MAAESYYDVLTAAVSDMAEHGYDSAERLAYWQRRLRDAAEASLAPDADMTMMLRERLTRIYTGMVDGGELARFHPGIQRFTVDKLRPHLRPLLDRRILASADLIRLNKKQAVEKTLQRFAGWSTSIPPGGAAEPDKRRVKKDIRKSLTQLPFEQRRVLIDQGHKLVSSINDLVATDGGAIAGEWHSHWRQPGYNYRPDHKERDLRVYAIRGGWAMNQGLMTKGAGYVDEMTRPAEEPFCRCSYRYLYNLRQLPEDMLTRKGRDELDRVRRAMAEVRAREHAG